MFDLTGVDKFNKISPDFGDRLMVGQWPLEPSIMVRIHVPEQYIK